MAEAQEEVDRLIRDATARNYNMVVVPCDKLKGMQERIAHLEEALALVEGEYYRFTGCKVDGLTWVADKKALEAK